MKVLLIVPPLTRFGGQSWHTFHLGVGYIAAVVREAGFDVAIYDANECGTWKEEPHPLENLYEICRSALGDPLHPVWLEIDAVIREQSPDVVGMTCRIPDIEIVMKIARMVKSINPKSKAILGGPAATVCSDLLLGEKAVDFVVRGEGEMTILELLKELDRGGRNFAAIEGLSFKDEHGKVVDNPLRALLDDLDGLPLPARDLMLYQERLPQAVLADLMGHLITSRGCPYGCTYCANKTVWGSRRVRMRSPESIVEEALHLRDTYDVHRLIFWDDHLTTRKTRIADLCNLLIQRRADVKWLSYVRADTVDAEILELMKRAGCYELQMGVESGSERILNRIGKGVTLEQIRRAAALLRNSGIRWHAFFMIGFPTETAEEMEATLQLLYELEPDSAELAVVTPYPGTQLFEDWRSSSPENASAWLTADIYRLDSVLVDTMPKEQFRELAREYKQAFEQYRRVEPTIFGRALRFFRRRLNPSDQSAKERNDVS